MSNRRPYGNYGTSMRGRHNTYERASSIPNGRDLYESLNKDPVETILKPPQDFQAPEQDLQPKDLTYIGSYNWVEATVPSIIVPG
jgi:hypothetical protein